MSMLGVMVDCSRNAVMSPERLREYAAILAKMGYNTLMLYTEDTYEMNDEPLFGHMRGRYTKQELKDFDKYCQSIGIELVPCVQTLAHLEAMFNWHEYGKIRDCDNILLLDDDNTEIFLRHMFDTLAECFTSRKVHIGMDEAYQVGLGQYLHKHGYTDRFELINRHLHKVCDIAKEHGFSTMIWSDMFCKLAAGVQDQYAKMDLNKIREKANLPDNVSLVYWDYYSNEYEKYEYNIHTNQAFDRPVVFAGGAWAWMGFTPMNQVSITRTELAFKACRNNGVDDIFLTCWGDNGAECSRFSVLPALLYGAEAYRGNYDLDSIKEKFYEMFHVRFDDFMLLDKPLNEAMTTKQALYNDPFIGVCDPYMPEGEPQRYEQIAKELRAVKERGEYGYLFDTIAALSEALAVKTDLGIRTRQAYQAGDKKALETLAKEVYPEVSKRVQALYDAFYAQWMKDSKPFGFEVQDIRFGGLLQRLKMCRERILEYVDGKTESIAELEEKAVLGHVGWGWAEFVTASRVN